MTNTTNAEMLTACNYPSTPFAASGPGRWISGDKIEVVEAPHFPGRSTERRYVAQRTTGGPCAWGPTAEEAAQAVRAL